MNIAELYEIYRQFPSVQTDTRKLKKGDLFFALRGPNFNANAFAETALNNGAAYAVIDDASYNTRANMLLVSDVLTALQELALFHRNQFNIPVLAITGSNGKTTTKELVHAVLSASFKTYTTQGNLNNHIGVPLTLLSVRSDAEIVVVEMGANHRGEIASYCVYARPDYGLITNIGKAHLEGFGGLEGVKKGKGELFDHLRANGGTAFVNWDYEYLRELSAGIETVVRYGSANATTDGSQETMITGTLIRSEPFLTMDCAGMRINTQLVGDYNFPNVLAAVAAGKHFGVPMEKIRQAIEAYAPSNSRSQLIEIKGNHIIMDAYNANPSSMKAAIENFAGMGYPDKVLILGGMAELGEESLPEHQGVVDLIAKYNWRDVVLVGGDFLNVKTSTPYTVLADSAAAAEWLRSRAFEQVAILVKGSRSMQMEKVIA